MRFKSGVCVCDWSQLPLQTVVLRAHHYLTSILACSSYLTPARTETKPKNDQLFRFSSHFSIIFNRLTVKCRFVA